MKGPNAYGAALIIMLAGLFALAALCLAQSKVGIAGYEYHGNSDLSFSADGRATISDAGPSYFGYEVSLGSGWLLDPSSTMKRRRRGVFTLRRSDSPSRGQHLQRF